jgi:hypothetical protein
MTSPRAAAPNGEPEEHLPVPSSISGTDLEKVIHRAAELQFLRDEVPDVIDEGEVVRIAEEVGLEGRHVRQALAELRADALLLSEPRDSGIAARLWGAGAVQASRVVPGSPHEVLASLEHYLREHESLICIRDQPGRQVWRPAEDLMSKLQRSFDFIGRGYELAKARRMEVRVEQLEEGRSLVTLTADLKNQRAGHVAGWLIPLVAVGTGAALGMHFAEGIPLLLGGPAAVGGTGLIGSFAANRTFRRRRERVEVAIQGLLDRLERGLSSSSGAPSLREKLTDWWESVTD